MLYSNVAKWFHSSEEYWKYMSYIKLVLITYLEGRQLLYNGYKSRIPESHQGKHIGNTVNFRGIEIYCINQLFLFDLMKGKVFIFKSKLNVRIYIKVCNY